MLWYIKNQLDLNLKEAARITVTEVPRKFENNPVYANCKMEDLLEKAMQQNFVPVLDDGGYFIGIVKRGDIMKYFASDMKKKKEKETVRFE